MSSRGVNSSNSGRGNNNGVSSIPAASRSMVQSLKEIVNCPEHEIYAMLKECNMNPDEAVERLLTQDTFHQVKSKREKKKETKETPESRSRASSSSNRGGKGAADRNTGRGVSAQYSSTESGTLHGKPAARKENGTNAYLGSSTSGLSATGANITRRPAYQSDSVDVEKKVSAMGSGDIFSSSQPSPGYQPAWVGAPGQVSLAEIVKRGKAQPNAPSRPISSVDTSYSRHNAIPPNTSYYSTKDPLVPTSLPSEAISDIHSLHDPSFKVSETVHDAGGAASQHAPQDDWPLESPSNNEVYGEPSLLSNDTDRTDLHPISESDEFRITRENLNVENPNMEYTESAPASSRHRHDDNDSFNNVNSYQPDHHEVDSVTLAVSAATADFQQISLQADPPAEDKPAVKIPNHLQIPNEDCMHLSFGSFRPGISATHPGSLAPKSHETTLEKVSAQTDVSSVGHPEIRNPEHFGDEQFRSTTDGNVDPRISSDSPSPQLEVMKQDTTEPTHEQNFNYAASMPDYRFENSTQMNNRFSYAHANPQMQNLGPFSAEMLPYSNSLLASNVQAARESDVSYSQFASSQSMPTKYSNAASSIGGPTVSMQETLKPSLFPTYPTQQNVPTASIATGPTIPQQLIQAYNLGQFYPFVAPPSYHHYMPSHFQQMYGGSSAYHEAQPAVPSGGMKYTKNGVPVSNFPQTASISANHGGFGGSVNIPGNFQLNQSTNPTSSTTLFDDVISSHFRENNHFVPQQSDSSALRLQQQAAGARSLSAVPASSYYGLQGQSLQQHSGFRQGQQQSSQHYGNLGGYNPNYSSHTGGGISQEHQGQHQTLNDGSFGGSQGHQPSKQSHQMWPQHPY